MRNGVFCVQSAGIQGKGAIVLRLSVGEAARLFGISVRTLRYYDEIGLLKPSEVSPSGYRYYDNAAVETLWQIMFYRELQMPLDEIAAVLNAPDNNRRQALKRHKELLLLRRNRLDRLVTLIDKTLNGDDTEMDIKNVSNAKKELERTREKYAAEVRERWGNTEAYKQSEKKYAGYTPEEKLEIFAEAGEIFKAFAASRGTAPESAPVQELVKRWQDHITKSHYDCSREILSCLGEMYVGDSRFTESIDRYGEGTARLMSEAIKIYCGA